MLFWQSSLTQSITMSTSCLNGQSSPSISFFVDGVCGTVKAQIVPLDEVRPVSEEIPIPQDIKNQMKQYNEQLEKLENDARNRELQGFRL
jgi:hypothetical protein